MEILSKAGLVGLIVLAGILLFTPYEAFFEGAITLAFIVAIVVGFLMVPRKDLFYVRTATRLIRSGRRTVAERDFVAVRVILVRLWLLFLPTALAVAFLVFFAAGGPEKFSVLNWSLSSGYGFVALQVFHLAPLFVLIVISAWISERRVMRNADACSARSYTVARWRVGYQFMGAQGEYFGGDCVYFGLVRPQELATIVFHNVKEPEINKIAMGFLFHGLTVVGRGVTDLDQETVAAQSQWAENLS